MDSVFSAWAKPRVAVYPDGMLWLEERGMGHRPNGYGVYDAAYFEEYARRERTELGERLIDARLALVADHYGAGPLVDVGIGAGGFVRARGAQTFGFDVNPIAIAWLQEAGLWFNLPRQRIAAATFWDSLEHVLDPGAILAQVREWVFISMPIFADKEHLRRSKHYKPEHLWYWTHDGLVAWMAAHGWALGTWNTQESDLGREDIESFAFRRTG